MEWTSNSLPQTATQPVQAGVPTCTKVRIEQERASIRVLLPSSSSRGCAPRDVINSSCPRDSRLQKLLLLSGERTRDGSGVVRIVPLTEVRELYLDNSTVGESVCMGRARCSMRCRQGQEAVMDHQQPL